MKRGRPEITHLQLSIAIGVNFLICLRYLFYLFLWDFFDLFPSTRVQAAPVQDTRVQGTPVQVIPVQATPDQATPDQTSLDQATPVQATTDKAS